MDNLYIISYIHLNILLSRFFIAIQALYIIIISQIQMRGPYVDKKLVSFRIEPQIVKKLKFIALEHDKTLTDLFTEAIQDIMKKYEKKAKK